MTVPSVDAKTYNRFLLTAGVALIALSVLTPTLLLEVSSGPLLTGEERDHLSEPSLQMLERREDLIDVAFSAVWPLSIVLMVVGAFALWVGIRRARERQAVADERENLENQHLRNQVRDSTPEERSSKLDAEVTEAMQEQIEADVTTEDIEGDSARRRESAKAEYAHAELLALNKLAEAFPSSRVHLGVAIEGATGPLLVDALVQFDNGNALLIEVKTQLTPSTTRGRDNARRLLSAIDAYESSTDGAVSGLLFYVLPPALAGSPSRKDFEARLVARSFEGWTPSAKRKIHLLVIGTDELEAISPNDFAERIAQIHGPLTTTPTESTQTP